MIIFKQKNKISFHTVQVGVKEKVEPSGNFLPKWFRKIKPKIPRTKVSHPDLPSEDIFTVKKCIPFLESMSSGYTIPLWSDLKIERLPELIFRSQNGQIIDQESFFLRKNENPKDFVGKHIHGQVIDAVEVGPIRLNLTFPEHSKSTLGGHLRSQVELEGRFKGVDQIFKLINPWSIRTPKGYSCFFKNPSNDFSKPITIFEGLVDTDTYYNPVAFPFFVSDTNFEEYTIKAGTPICQVIPIKREKLDLGVGLMTNESVPENTFSVFSNYYRKHNWHKKRVDND